MIDVRIKKKKSSFNLGSFYIVSLKNQQFWYYWLSHQWENGIPNHHIDFAIQVK